MPSHYMKQAGKQARSHPKQAGKSPFTIYTKQAGKQPNTTKPYPMIGGNAGKPSPVKIIEPVPQGKPMLFSKPIAGGTSFA